MHLYAKLKTHQRKLLIMSRETIKQILMRRDNLSANDADILISEAIDAFKDYLDEGDQNSAYNICAEYFGLEPDYLDELI
jgi:hypothetical protein